MFIVHGLEIRCKMRVTILVGTLPRSLRRGKDCGERSGSANAIRYSGARLFFEELVEFRASSARGDQRREEAAFAAPSSSSISVVKPNSSRTSPYDRGLVGGGDAAASRAL